MKSGRRIGIMGGTFDPIHYGHLVTAEEALVQFNLDKVIFMPTGQPAAKARMTVTSREHRYLMTVIATATNPDFEVSRLELDRPGVTYTVDTLRMMREQEGPSTALFFITGADAVLEIISWKDAREATSLATFIAATRPGYDLEAAQEERTVALPECRVEHMEVPALAISSTDIRRRVAERRPIRYLAPEPVVAYIHKNLLYKDAE